MEDFKIELGNELSHPYDTIETYLKDGFPFKASCQEICTAIQNIYERFVSDENISVEIREQAKKVQASFGKMLFDHIDFFENVMSIIESDKPFFEKTFRKYLTVNLFMCGVWPEDGETLTCEEVDWLRESLLQFPPKGIKAQKNQGAQ